ncbi:MAG: hypothetical protein ACJ75J_11955 [Cytophagaceae bacterium]
MEDIRVLRRWENIHIPLWLIKDTCWMMEWKTLGITMITPTIAVALLITYKTRNVAEFYINLAISFWISANAYWMCCEFLGHVELKNYAGYPFIAGFICCGIFYYKKMIRKVD